jgi:O-Antigen ligase
MTTWPTVASVLVIGYLAVSRAFAYLGVPAWHLFIGEVVLALFFLAGPKLGEKPWVWAALKMPILKRLWTWYALFLGYGILHVVYGIKQGYPPLVAARDLAFNYYPLYFLLGLWVGVMRPDGLPRLIRAFAWFNGLYGLLFILFLNRAEWFVPGVSEEIEAVPIFGQPIYSFVALLGLLVYERSLWRSWYLCVLNGFVMLGMQIRTEWIAFAVGVVTWCIVTRQAKRALQAGVVLACLLAVMYIADFKIRSPEGRTDADISVKQFVDRAIAPFRADVQDQASAAGIGNVDPQEATFVFRTAWWFAIWNSVNSDLVTALWGHGYGFALTDLVPYLEGNFTRTPHNEIFYALGYTGWLGVILFSLFELQILRLLWRVFRATNEPFGVVFWVAAMTYGMFFPVCETPYGAVPFYVITGWLCASVAYGKRYSRVIGDGQQPVRLGISGANPPALAPS